MMNRSRFALVGAFGMFGMVCAAPASAESYINPADYVFKRIGDSIGAVISNAAQSWAAGFLNAAAKSIEDQATSAATTAVINANTGTVTTTVSKLTFDTQLSIYKAAPATAYSWDGVNSNGETLVYTKPSLVDYAGFGYKSYAYTLNYDFSKNTFDLKVTYTLSAGGSKPIDVEGEPAVINLVGASDHRTYSVDFSWSRVWKSLSADQVSTKSLADLSGSLNIGGTPATIKTVPGPVAGASLPAALIGFGLLGFAKVRRRAA